MPVLRLALRSVLLVILLGTVADGAATRAQATATRPSTAVAIGSATPTVQVDPSVGKPGQKVTVTVEGFDVRYVFVSVCGNQALRGSSDCNMVASKSFELKTDGESSSTVFQITPPPMPCPCLIRVSSPADNEVATVPFELTGHPTAAVTRPGDAGQPLVEVEVHSQRATGGLIAGLRASLGGATDYDVSVKVHNLTSEPLRKVVLSGAVGRSARDSGTGFELPSPGAMAANAAFEQTVRVRMPAPSIGTFVFSATAAGAGPSVTGVEQIHPTPWLLIVFVGVLVVDIGLLVIRRLMARRAHHAPASSGRDGAVDPDRTLINA